MNNLEWMLGLARQFHDALMARNQELEKENVKLREEVRQLTDAANRAVNDRLKEIQMDMAK